MSFCFRPSDLAALIPIALAFWTPFIIYANTRSMYQPSALELETWRVGNMTADEKRALGVRYFPEVFREDGPSLLDVMQFAVNSHCLGWDYYIAPEKHAACKAVKAHLSTFSLAREVKID